MDAAAQQDVCHGSTTALPERPSRLDWPDLSLARNGRRRIREPWSRAGTRGLEDGFLRATYDEAGWGQQHPIQWCSLAPQARDMQPPWH